MIQGLTDEYEANETPEARLAHDADKIETLLQAIEYQAQGHDTAAWRETSLAALRTDEGRQLAQAIGSADPQAGGQRSPRRITSCALARRTGHGG